MTAIVSILNKHAVAIAADSAVTFGHKVVNCGNKIFTLSKYHPIAIMTYNNASYMGVPWDVIIKLYRKQLGDRELDTVTAYLDDFLSFLHKQELYNAEESKLAIANAILSFYNTMINKAKKEIAGFDEKAANAFEGVKDTLHKYKGIFQTSTKNVEFAGYTYDKFLQQNDASISLFKTWIKRVAIPDAGYDCLLESYYEYLLISSFYDTFSGLVFIGYGRTELFPSSEQILLWEKIGDRIKFDRGSAIHVGDGGSPAWIVPYAQINVEKTIVQGIHPDIKDLIFRTFSNIMNQIGQNIRGFNAGLYSNLFRSQIEGYISANHIDPLMDTIVNLDKEDMADMAESIVSLTSLMKRVSPEEETVGGPVDVAVISKGDGFIWMKRKHYFQPELNPHFFSNYFRNNNYGEQQ